MKKHLVILAVCFLGLFFSTKIYTQNINATLTINPYPSPYVTDWQNNPAALGSITIFNNSGRSFKIVIKTSIATQGRGEVLTCTTQPIQLTEQPVQIINNTQFINFSDVAIKNSDYKQKAQQSGRLLEGVYIVCFTIEDLNGVVLVPKLCSNFTILYPPPPHLIYPANLDTLDLNTNYPTFQWTPVVVPSAYQIKYTIRIVEVLQGQIPSQAISSNVPIYENNQLVTNSLTYPIGAFPLEAGKKYAWQVQCLDQYGLPPTQNQGRSEIFTFVKKKLLSPHFTQILLLLESPENNEAIKTKTPIFRWKITPQPSVNVKYNIRVVKVLPNQNLETAIHNYPIINTTTTATSYEPSQPLSLNASDTYAWQVYALNSATNDTIAKSEIRKFTLFKLILLLPNNNTVVNNKKPTFQWAFYGNKKYYDLVVKEIRVNINSPDGSVSDDIFKDPYNLIIYQKQDIDGAAISSVNQQGLEVPVFTPEYDIPMEEGKSYYWQVWVKDQPSGYIQGRSEIRKFDYNPFQPGFATNCSVSGTLYYQFATPGDNEKWQLKNINIKFVVKYILKYTSYKGTWSFNGQTSPQGEIEIPITSLSPNYQSDYNKTIAVTKTDAQGNFFFSFWNSKPMGVIDNNFTFSNGGPPEQSYSYSGKLYRVIKLIVESPYYTSPRTDIIVQPGENRMYNSMVAQVRSYSLNVTVRSPNEYWHNPQFLSSNSPISNMLVYILRKNKPGEVPSNEGLPSPTDSTESPFPGSYQAGYKVIAKEITDSKGQVTFERLVKSVYSQNDEYFIYVIADSTSTTLLYQSLIPISFKFKNQGDNAVYNYEYQYPVTSTDVVAFPINPIVKGKIKRQDGGQPIWLAQVKLLVRDVMGYVEEAKQFTNPNGEFRFENLADNVVDLQGNVIVPIRYLQITKYGFRDTILPVNDGVPLKPGVFWSREILLQPESKIIGKIVNEYGEGISAWVTVDGGESQEVIAPVPSTSFAPKRAPASFSLQAPTGSVRVIFDPIDKSYMKDTVDIIITGSVYDMGTIVLKRAMHRIKVFVGIETNIPLHPEITGAKVKLVTFDGDVFIGEKRTDSQGYAEFMFFNTAKDYKITVSAPPGKDFQTSQMTIYNTESKDWKFYNIYLKPATSISGYVYVGNNKQPVPNAKITIKGNSNGTFPVAYTDSNGYYVLHNVPIGLNKFVASKKSSNLIGDTTGILIVPKEGLQNVNFNLKVYSDMDITHLLGFPIEVYKLVEQNNEVLISGEFVDLDSLKNDIFSSTTSEIAFTNISIVPDSILKSKIFDVEVPVSKPKQLPLKTDANTLDIKVFEPSYFGVIYDNKIGIELMTVQTGYGVIKGKAKVVDGSFNIPSQNLSFTSGGFYLKAPDTADMKLPVITADKSSPLNTNKFLITDSLCNQLQFSLFGFTSDADAQKSYLYKDSVVLNTTLHTNLQGVEPSDVNLNIGDVSLTKDKINPLINKTTPIKLSLDQWTLEINKWSLNGDLIATAGTLKTNLVDIQLKELTIAPKELKYFNLELKSMSLGGVAQLKVIGHPMFGYEDPGNGNENQGNKKWYLTVTVDNNIGNYAAIFGGLPGMDVKDSICLSSFSLYSDGGKAFTLQSKTIQIYKVGKLSLDQMMVGDNSIELSLLNFDIPGLGLLGTKIQYFKENNQIKFKLVQVPIKINTKGVDLAFGTDAEKQPEVLDDNGLRVRGTISEEGKFSFNAWLYHTQDSTSIWVENPNLPTPPGSPPKNWQTLEIGGPLTYLEKITGNMRVVSNSWQNFWFSGNLIVPSGIEQNKNKLTFTVNGDSNIVANNQELGVTNINSPFGNISFTYEPEYKRFFGSLSFEKDLGYAKIKGDAQAVVDNEGWYFFAGGELEVNNPHSKGSAGLLIGNHSITNTMRNTFQQYSYVYRRKGSLPSIFPSSLKGFYMEGEAEASVLPMLGLPDVDIDLGIVSARLRVIAGADMRLSMQFSNGTITIGAGMDNFVEADFGLGASVGLACASVDCSASLDIGFEGQVSSDYSWSAELTGDITLTGTAKVGGGGCDSDCDGYFCVVESASVSKTFGIIGHIGSDKKYMNFYVK